MRNSSFLIGVWLSLMRNGPFLIGSELSAMRNSSFLIGVWLSLMRNGPFLIGSGPSPMRNNQFLSWRELPPVRHTPIPDLALPSRNEGTAILHSYLASPNHGMPACPRTAERLSQRIPIAGQNLYGEKHDPHRNFLQRLFAKPGDFGPVAIL